MGIICDLKRIIGCLLEHKRIGNISSIIYQPLNASTYRITRKLCIGASKNTTFPAIRYLRWAYPSLAMVSFAMIILAVPLTTESQLAAEKGRSWEANECIM